MLFSALQTKGIIGFNCKINESGVWFDTLIINDANLLNTIQTLVPSFQEERSSGNVKVRIPSQAGLYRDETLEVCP